MESSKIVIRVARRNDAVVIAQAVAMAIGDEVALQNYCGEDYIATLTEIASRSNTQYSWQTALIAEVNGSVAGAVIGYDGAHLSELREGTFATLQGRGVQIASIADETEAGEYYLDSLGVLPEFRGLGIGAALVKALCEKAYAEGHKRVGLIVDVENPQAEKLYASLGFERVGTKLFFGHRMWHLQRTNPLDIRERILHSTRITAFQRQVYLELLNTPAGQTITYGELARRIGCRSAQAVGQALKRNPFAPDVPCHRVICSDGSLGGYHGKRTGEMTERKRELLKQEQIHIK